jgi:hypothetical protein
MFDHQDEWGHLPDYVNDMYSMHRTSKPPIQGYVYLWLKEHRDMSFLSKEQLEAFYGAMGKWCDWWTANRIAKCSGLPYFGHPTNRWATPRSTPYPPSVSAPSCPRI